MISRLSRLSRRLKVDKYIQIPENCKRHGKRHGMLGTEPDCYGHSAPWHWGPHQAPWRGACAQMSWNHVKSHEIMWNHVKSWGSTFFGFEFKIRASRAQGAWRPSPMPAVKRKRRTLQLRLRVNRSCLAQPPQIYRSHSTYEMAGRSKWHLTRSLAHIFFAYSLHAPTHHFVGLFPLPAFLVRECNLLQTLWLHDTSWGSAKGWISALEAESLVLRIFWGCGDLEDHPGCPNPRMSSGSSLAPKLPGARKESH